MTKESSVALPMPQKNRTFLVIGCCLLMFFVASEGAALAILQTPMLLKMDQFDKFPIVAVSGSIGICIMTPIGGKLGDIFGRRNLIIGAGLLSLVGVIGIAFIQSFIPYIFFRILISLAQGAFTAAPYILVNQVFEREKVPKNMGFLSSGIAIGTFLGALSAGFLADKNLIALAIILPCVFLIIALILVAIYVPNVKSPTKIKLDVAGIFLLIILMISMVLTLNFGVSLGWFSPLIIAGAVITILSIFSLYKVESTLEKNGGQPIISMQTLRNKDYSVLLIIGITAYVYQTPMLSYGAMASMEILGTNATLAGLLTMPRTIITMFLPMLAGAWLGKKATNSWKSMAIGTGVTAVCLLPMAFISPSMSFIVVLAAFSITGIAESFRAVSITPAAQQQLSPETIASGTALINFSNTFAGVLSASISGTLYQAAESNMALGIRLVFGFSIGMALIGFLLTIFYVRPKQIKNSQTL